ncbi:hypothetical protein [Kibdelosporangium philippinense]|uniref:hypothetical protein n=1 Tax=Kibdelosporangium philippinense TaxID=211113 RepID=UPI00360DDFBA
MPETVSHLMSKAIVLTTGRLRLGLRLLSRGSARAEVRSAWANGGSSTGLGLRGLLSLP